MNQSSAVELRGLFAFVIPLAGSRAVGGSALDATAA